MAGEVVMKASLPRMTFETLLPTESKDSCCLHMRGTERASSGFARVVSVPDGSFDCHVESRLRELPKIRRRSLRQA